MSKLPLHQQKPVPVCRAEGRRLSFSIREDEDTKATIVLVEYDGITLPLWWCGNTLQGWHTGAEIPESLMLAARAVAMRLGVVLRC